MEKGEAVWRKGGHFNDDNPLKDMRSVPNVLRSFPLNVSLVYFVIIMNCVP